MPKTITKQAPYNAVDVAKYFIYLASRKPIGEGEDGKKIYEGITNLKLQKILYFAQAYYLVKTGNPLFKENIEAWQYGSVVRVVYNKYKAKDAGYKPLIEQQDTSPITPQDKKLMQSVWEIFGKHSARNLVDIIHSQSPWKDAYENGANTKIETGVLKEYYKDMFVAR